MKRISKNLSAIGAHYDVIVVGSGYGGGVAASRMARAGKKVCLLERGRELLPGEYPNDLSSAKDNIQVDAPGAHIGSRTALYDFRANDDMNVLLGCGLGGTSLINANVALELDPRVFKSEAWPQPADGKSWIETLGPYYALARTMLDSRSYPDDFPKLNKLEALKKSAKAMHQPCYPPPINVNFKDRVNPFGVKQKACNLCGDCCSGCNVTAKNTTLMNYLPDAHNHGAEIFTEASVQYVTRQDKGWKVIIKDLGKKNEDTIEVESAVLILSAGSLGSTEILLRSRHKGLSLSPMLGKHFSGNGDVLAFGYNSYWNEKDKNKKASSPELYGIGIGDNLVAKHKYPGPCITGVIDMRETAKDVKDGLVIEEGVIPGAFATLLPGAFFFADTQYGNFFQYGPDDAKARLEDAQKLSDAMKDPNSSMTDLAYEGGAGRTQTYLVMSQDDSDGKLILKDDRIRIQWEGIGKSRVIKRDNRKIEEANEAIKGQFFPNPTWTDPMGKKLITVHPVGGCRMGSDASKGVVDTRCRVFSNDRQAVHEGLYVMDGAVLPGAAGVNPLLTITALSERACHLMRDVNIDYNLNGQSIEPHATEKTEASESKTAHGEQNAYDRASKFAGPLAKLWDAIREFFVRIWKYIKHQLFLLVNRIVQYFANRFPEQLSPSLSFKETMQGYFTKDFVENPNPSAERISNDFEIAYRQGKAEQNAMAVHLLIEADNIYKTVSDARHAARVNGQVICKMITGSDEPMNATGTFYLFPVDRNKVETWNMIYDMEMASNGDVYHFYGEKILHKEPGSSWWDDTTTLFVNVFRKEQNNEKMVGKGILNLTLEDLMKQGTTISIKSTNPFLKRLPGFVTLLLEEIFMQKFAAFFGMVLFKAYAGMLTDLANFQKDEDEDRLRHHPRQLRAPKPEVFYVKTSDGAQIRLTRYQAGTKGPLIMAPGFTVNASSFATNTVDENLVEYLSNVKANGSGKSENYDIWLFDYRVCPDAGNGPKPYNVDQIALNDWPAAVQFVREKTGAKDVQALVHCVGSMSFLMAKLKGLEGVRSAICSQLTLHPVTNWLNYLKADMHMVKMLEEKHKIDKIDIRSSDSTKDKAMDAALWEVPVPDGEACTNPCCRRIFAVYGPSYAHSQLNHNTHIAMREWFGEISTASFDQLTTILRLGYTVDRHGRNTYLPKVKMLNIPIQFIAGDLNQEFFPETSLRTYEWLKDHCDPSLFSRYVFKGYAHMDLFIGKNASKEIFPELLKMLRELDRKTNTASVASAL